MKKIFAGVLIAILIPSCSVLSKKNKYQAVRNNFFGIQETGIPAVNGVKGWIGGTSDPYLTQDMIADLAAAMGFKAYRIWMNLDDLFMVNPDNTITMRSDRAAFFRNFIAKLINRGIDNIIAVNCGYLYPYGYCNPAVTWAFGAFPDPLEETEQYKIFMSFTEQAYAQLAAFFQEIKYWESGNEINDDVYCNRLGYAMGQHDRTYSTGDKAHIITDLMFYANRGIKMGNPHALSVMPGLVFNTSPANTHCGEIKAFLTVIYQNIASGAYPSANIQPAEKSTDNNDYFDILNWHPYEFGAHIADDSIFMTNNKQLFSIAANHGDENKKAFFTEFGWSNTQDFSLDELAVRERTGLEKLQADYLQNCIDAILNELPLVETVVFFRLFDWEQVFNYTWAAETGFGLFSSPGTFDLQELKDHFGDQYVNRNYFEEFNVCKPKSAGGKYGGPRPKAVAIKLFELINGTGASKKPLYQYHK